MLNFWATWCAPCRIEMPTLAKLQTELGGLDFAVVPVATLRNTDMLAFPRPAKSTLYPGVRSS